MTRILIADDHQMFIDGIKALLKGHKAFTVVGEARNGAELLEVMDHTQAHLVLMDINMQVMDGIAATKEVRARHPDVKVLMLTMFNSRDYIEKVLKAGAHGYILKNTGKEELATAIETVMKGESYFGREVTDRIMESLQGRKAAPDPLLTELTEREKDVLKLIVQEHTTQEIADKLCISHHTVETHRKNLISKLQVRNVAGLVRYAIECGLG